MSCMATNILLLFCSILVSIIRIEAIDITAMLQNRKDFEQFNMLLTQTGLAANINNRQPLTILLLDNDAVGSIVTKPLAESAKILATHVILDYYDEDKLKDLHGSVLLTTLFQTTGVAGYGQGFLNMTATENGIVIRSAAPSASMSSKVIKSVASEPYNIALVQIDRPIFTPGISQIPPSISPSRIPISLVPAPAHAPYGRILAPAPTPVTVPTPAHVPYGDTLAPTPTPITVPAPHYEDSPVPAPAPHFEVPTPVLVPAPYEGVPSPHEGPSPVPTPAPAPAPHQGPALVSFTHEGPAPYIGLVPTLAPTPHRGGHAHAPSPKDDVKTHESISPESESPLVDLQTPFFSPEHSPKKAPTPSPNIDNDAPSPQDERKAHESLSPESNSPLADEETHIFSPEHSPEKAPAPSPSPKGDNGAPGPQDDEEAHHSLSPESQSPLDNEVEDLFGPEYSPMNAPTPTPNGENDAPSPQNDEKAHVSVSPEFESPLDDHTDDFLGPEHSPKKSPNPTPGDDNDVPADISSPAKLKITNAGESLRVCSAVVLVTLVGLATFSL